MIENILHNGQLLAIIIRSTHNEPGITFFTPENFSQQLAFMKHPPGMGISPHVHNPVQREVIATQEVLFMRKGKIRIDIYDGQRNYLESRILGDGDVILLAAGGHGIEVLEDAEIVEVKQGPYTGDRDKTRFAPVDRKLVRVEG